MTKTVRSNRRRRTTSDGPRQRAEAPRRQKQPTSRPRPTSGGGGSFRPRPPRPSGGGGGGKLPLPIIGLLVVVFICFALYSMFNNGGDGGSDFNQSDFAAAPTEVVQQQVSLPTSTPKPFTPPAAVSGDGQTWLIMLYQDADDKILEQDIYVDLNEAERVGSSERVHIVAQVDRFRAGYRGDGDWSAARRFYVTQDDDLERVQSQQIADLGEVNMADGETLVDFVTWAVENFPADKHVLILSDHGIGWPGGWSDPEPGSGGSSIDRSIPLTSALGDELYLMELDEALGKIRETTGLEQFELIGMDACLMGHLEVFSALAPHARYAVASQETEPALGWAYTGFLQALQDNPNMTGADLSKLIVQSYIQEDQRIVDDEARAEFVGRGSPMSGLFGMLGGPSAEQITQQLGQNITLTAIDLEVVPALVSSVNELAFALQNEDQRTVAQARSYAQSFTSVFGNNVPPSYIDLGNFAQLIKRNSSSSEVGSAVDGVMAALNRAVVAEKHGPKKPGATGVSIYFPNSQLYQSPVTGPQSYTAVARRFATESLWDEFLAFHYTGRQFRAAEQTIAVPERSEPVVAPGSGKVQVSALSVSNNVTAPGNPILLSADISGDNLGYVYLFVGFFDQDANSVLIADTDYLEGETTRENDGVYYPDWGRDEFTMEFEWEPIVFAISNGVDWIEAHFTPQSYGASFEEALYTVDGIYTYADGGESRYARLYFVNGIMTQAFGFTGEGGTGAPREIIPQTGDRFTVLEKWMDLGNQGEPMQVAQQEGGTLTFTDQPFTWLDLDAAPGAYIVGFIVEDLDGNAYEVYENVTVQ